MIQFFIHLFKVFKSGSLKRQLGDIQASVQQAHGQAVQSEEGLKQAITHLSIELGEVAKVREQLGRLGK